MSWAREDKSIVLNLWKGIVITIDLESVDYFDWKQWKIEKVHVSLTSGLLMSWAREDKSIVVSERVL